MLHTHPPRVCWCGKQHGTREIFELNTKSDEPLVFATGGPITKPHPYCQECDEPLDWCIHGDGSAWANNPAYTFSVPEIGHSPVPPAKPDQRVMWELQQNGWSLEGIARLYQITPFAAQMFIRCEEQEQQSNE